MRPSISVVVPARGEGALVARLVASFVAARENHQGEVTLVVCDASEPVESAVIQNAVLAAGGNYVTAVHPGSSEQRNVGARESSGDIVLFVDSDCVMDSELLTVVASVFEDVDVGAMVGKVEFFGPEGWVFRSARRSGVMDGFSGFGMAPDADVPWGPTANFAIRRELFDRVGGFDESLGLPRSGGEDVDLGLRLGAAGASIRYVPAAVVRHPTGPWNGLRSMLARLAAYGAGDVGLMVRHPHLAVSAGPNLATAGALATVFAVALALIDRSPLAAGLAPVWWVCALLTIGAFTAVGAPRGDRGSAVLLGVLMLTLDGGRLAEAVRTGRWRLLASYPLLDPKQLDREWGGVLATWFAVVLATVVVVATRMIWGA